MQQPDAGEQTTAAEGPAAADHQQQEPSTHMPGGDAAECQPAETVAALKAELERTRSQLSEAKKEADLRTAQTVLLQEQLQQALSSKQQQQQAAAKGGAGSFEIARSASATPRLRGAEPGGDEDRLALRLHKAEHALEQERLTAAHLRRQLEAAQQLQPQPAPGPGAPVDRTLPGAGPLLRSGPSASSGGGGGGGSGPGSSPSLHRMSEVEELRQEAAVAQAQLLQRTVELERLRRLAGEREEEARKLRRELEGLKAAGGHTAQLQNQIQALMEQESGQRVQARAAEDRCRAAERVSLDMRQQCEAAALTIGRLIDESSELVSKINAQANTMSELRTELRKRDTGIRALEQLLLSQGRPRVHSGSDGGGGAGGEGRRVAHDVGSATVGGSDGGAGAGAGSQQQQQEQEQELHSALMAAVAAAVTAQEGGGAGPPRPEGSGGVAAGAADSDPDELLKLQALQDEVIRMEQELAREREGRAALAAAAGGGGATPFADGAAPTEGGEVRGGSRAEWGLLSSAAASGGLPLRLRIQALAQTLAALDEELERERGAAAALRRQVDGQGHSGGETPSGADDGPLGAARENKPTLDDEGVQQPGVQDTLRPSDPSLGPPQERWTGSATEPVTEAPGTSGSHARQAAPSDADSVAPAVLRDVKDGALAPPPPTYSSSGPGVEAADSGASRAWRPGGHLHGEITAAAPSVGPWGHERAASGGGRPAALHPTAEAAPPGTAPPSAFGAQTGAADPGPAAAAAPRQQHLAAPVPAAAGATDLSEVQPLQDLVLTPKPRTRKGVWGWNWLVGGDLVAY